MGDDDDLRQVGQQWLAEINSELVKIHQRHRGKPVTAFEVIANCAFWTALLRDYMPHLGELAVLITNQLKQDAVRIDDTGGTVH